MNEVIAALGNRAKRRKENMRIQLYIDYKAWQLLCAQTRGSPEFLADEAIFKQYGDAKEAAKPKRKGGCKA
jgi:hypothetical protein